MSIEKLVAELIEAVKENTAAIRESNGEDKQPAKTESKAAKSEPKKEAAKEPEKTPGIPYDDVKNKTLELVKAKGRDAVTALLKDFGKDVASAKDLKPEQYEEYLAKVAALLTEDDVA